MYGIQATRQPEVVEFTEIRLSVPQVFIRKCFNNPATLDRKEKGRLQRVLNDAEKVSYQVRHLLSVLDRINNV